MIYKMSKYYLYTDGACSKNPGPGGWAFILLNDQEQSMEQSGYVNETTNNRMELLAVLKGLLAIDKNNCSVDIFTDSAYVCNAFTCGWILAWQNNGWKNSQKKPVENQDIWKEILNQTKGRKVYWHKVEGHADNIYNNRCDKLATSQVKNNMPKKP